MASDVEISVLRRSKGRVVRPGDQLGVLYSGTLIDGNGTTFDANFDFKNFAVIPGRGLFDFTLGSGQVIQGWDQGLLGRRLGEVVDLRIPADLAYGSEGAPPSIPPNADLLFRVELVGAIPAGSSKPVFATYTDLGLSNKLAAQLDGIKPPFAASKVGTDADDELIGGAARDLLLGLAGGDRLEGGEAPDVLIGGSGANRFVYTSSADSRPGRGNQDQLLGFQRSGDQIDLSALGETLSFIGKQAFSQTPGEVRFGSGVLQLDQDGDGRADLELLLVGVKRFSATNLVL